MLKISSELFAIAARAPDSPIGIDIKVLATRLAKEENRLRKQRERTARFRAKRDSNVTVTQRDSNVTVTFDENHSEEKRDCNVTVTLQELPVTKKERKKEESKKERKEEGRSHGSRLSPLWKPSMEETQFAIDLGFSEVEVTEIAATFLDYWIAVAGSKGSKTNWPATWRNWVRRQNKPQKSLTSKSSNAKPLTFREANILRNQDVINAVLGSKNTGSGQGYGLIQSNGTSLGATTIRAVPEPDSDNFNF